jgi:hypothetical protein
MEKMEKMYKEQIEKLEYTIKTLQSQPNINNSHNTTNSHNVTNNNNIKIEFNMTHQHINDIVKKFLTEQHLNKGINGIVDFTFDHLITTDSGDIVYVLSDASRNVFKYFHNGKEIRDKDAKNLKTILGPIIYDLYSNKVMDLRNKIDIFQLKQVDSSTYEHAEYAKEIKTAEDKIDRLLNVKDELQLLKKSQDKKFATKLSKKYKKT